MTARIDVADRFWTKVAKSDGCWVWTASLSANGYGQIKTHQPTIRPRLAHRIAYELTYGAIPEGLSVCHHCDNRKCVRPDHLFLGTVRDNALDAFRKGRLSAQLEKAIQGNMAAAAKRSHCRRGHSYGGGNAAVSKHGKRTCRVCQNESNRQYRQRRAELGLER